MQKQDIEREVNVMDNKTRVKVIYGQHKGKVGIITGMFWAANAAIIMTESGEEISVKPIEITTID